MDDRLWFGGRRASGFHGRAQCTDGLPEEPSRIPDLDAAAADLRIDLEVESRRRERWIRHRLAEEATLAGRWRPPSATTSRSRS